MVSVVVPAYGQAAHIRSVLTEYDSALRKLNLPFEIVVVVNGPNDGTLEECKLVANELSSIRVERSAPGWGCAVQQGLFSVRGDLICYTNSARTSASDLLVVLLFAVAYPDVVVKANRKIRDSAWRRLGSLLYNLECRALFDIANFDVNGTPKAFPRRFDELLSMTRRDDVIDAEFNALCHRHQYPMLEVPIVSGQRREGRSTTTFWSALRLYLGAYLMWRRSFR